MANTVALIGKRTTHWRLKHSLYSGLQSRVARSLGISRSVVCQVMNGSKTSKRVATALEKEFSRVERVIARNLERAA
jgi:DNA-binding transcriptional regulator YdaS (Cro superfamily)